MSKLFSMIWVRTSVIGFHHWKDAPPNVSYLRSHHRHEFGIRVTVCVGHDDRHVEFHTLKQRLTLTLPALFSPLRAGEFDFGGRSCETIAAEIGCHLKGQGFAVSEVEVSEDGENGATVRFQNDTETT